MIARFMAEIKGSAGPTSRVGNAESGIWGHIRGWHLGANVRMIVNDDGNDELIVSVTGGSKNPNDMQVVFQDEHGQQRLVDIGREFRLIIPKRVPIVLDVDN